MNGSAKRTMIWGSLLASIAVYLGLAFFLGRERLAPGRGELPMLPVILGGVAVGIALAATYFWRRAQAAREESAAYAGPRAEEPLESLTPWLVCWGLDEGVAILGFVLALLGFPASAWLGFFVGGAALLVIHR